MKPMGIYVHVPFCLQKCNYCDFLSFEGFDGQMHRAYFESIIKEIALQGGNYNKKFYVDSIFIGGGTPSLVEPTLIKGLMEALKNHFSFAKSCEITIESNPKTLSGEKLTTYLDCGINRLSLGVQSLEKEILSTMGRVHNSQDVRENYAMARACGFKNINLDLMFAVPGMTMDMWEHTLEEVNSLSPEHLSMYSLQLEEGTPFFRDFEAGLLKEIPDELDRKMYWEGLAYLKRCGYHHYEISNLSKDGFSCKHNLKYWSMEDYLGIGLGAHSFVNDCRFSNETNLQTYIKNWETNLKSVVTSEESATKINRQWEYIFTGMRKISGISISEFQEKYGIPLTDVYGDVILRLEKKGLLLREGDYMKFTPLGIDLSNSVLAEFI